jgi:membrane protease YdiL (CAAX protease family)
MVKPIHRKADRMSGHEPSVKNRPADATSTEWRKLLAGLAVTFGLFHGLATALGSDRGQAGLLVTAAVVAALLAAEWLLFRETPAEALVSLGFGRPALRGMLASVGVCVAMLAVIPAYAAWHGASVMAYPGWVWLLPGLFAQAGIAEEALFRGYLFGRLRRGHSFWRAAALATAPFVVVHLILFATMPWPIALVAVLLSVILSFPLAHLFELAGNTIWAPALLHFTVQGAIKVVELPGDTGLPLVWMAAGAAIPSLILLSWRPSPRPKQA